MLSAYIRNSRREPFFNHLLKRLFFAIYETTFFKYIFLARRLGNNGKQEAKPIFIGNIFAVYQPNDVS